MILQTGYQFEFTNRKSLPLSRFTSVYSFMEEDGALGISKLKIISVDK